MNHEAPASRVDRPRAQLQSAVQRRARLGSRDENLIDAPGGQLQAELQTITAIEPVVLVSADNLQIPEAAGLRG